MIKMPNEKCIVLIPVRMESSRLAGKPMRKIAGIPMIIHVAIRSSQCPIAERTIVCTDSADIIFECEKYGIEVCNTRNNHLNGTDRIAEAAILLKLSDNQIIVDVQGDEPFVNINYISEVASNVAHSQYGCVVPYQDFEESNNPNRVKIVSSFDKIIYFSRSDVPNYFGQVNRPMKKHLSIIGFRLSGLKKFVASAPTPLENIERIELMRLIELGVPIGTFLQHGSSLSVDTMQDYELACRMMVRDDLFKKMISSGGFDARN